MNKVCFQLLHQYNVDCLKLLSPCVLNRCHFRAKVRGPSRGIRIAGHHTPAFGRPIAYQLLSLFLKEILWLGPNAQKNSLKYSHNCCDHHNHRDTIYCYHYYYPHYRHRCHYNHNHHCY